MARPKNRIDLRPEMQGALNRAFKIMEADGRPLSTIWLELFQNDPANAMRLAIQMLPKEVEMEVTEAMVDSTMITPEILRQAFEYKRQELSGTSTGDSELH